MNLTKPVEIIVLQICSMPILDLSPTNRFTCENFLQICDITQLNDVNL